MSFIDREELKRAMKLSSYYEDPKTHNQLIGRERVFAVIDGIPAAKVESAIEGEWWEDQCSICGKRTTDEYAVNYQNTFDYCPWCGARMQED